MEYVVSREIPPVVYVPISGVEEGRAGIDVRRLRARIWMVSWLLSGRH